MSWPRQLWCLNIRIAFVVYPDLGTSHKIYLKIFIELYLYIIFYIWHPDPIVSAGKISDLDFSLHVIIDFCQLFNKFE
jgi:hypothetical protein